MPYQRTSGLHTLKNASYKNHRASSAYRSTCNQARRTHRRAYITRAARTEYMADSWRAAAGGLFVAAVALGARQLFARPAAPPARRVRARATKNAIPYYDKQVEAFYTNRTRAFGLMRADHRLLQELHREIPGNGYFERNPHFIQWLFPSPVRSGGNNNAPLLSEMMAEHFSHNGALRKTFMDNMRWFLDHLGISWHMRDDTLVIYNENRLITSLAHDSNHYNRIRISQFMRCCVCIHAPAYAWRLYLLLFSRRNVCSVIHTDSWRAWRTVLWNDCWTNVPDDRTSDTFNEHTEQLTFGILLEWYETDVKNLLQSDWEAHGELLDDTLIKFWENHAIPAHIKSKFYDKVYARFHAIWNPAV